MITLILQNDSNEWKELDIKDVDIVLHKAFQNLEDPSTIESAYTLNVNLPFTEKNDRVLKALYRLEYVNVPGSYSFDSKKKYKFKLLNDEWILYEGDFVLDNVVISSNPEENYYHVTLFDELYNVFKKLDYTIANPNESIDNTESTVNIEALNGSLTANLVKDSWTKGNQFFSMLDQNGRIRSDITNGDLHKYIGFIPTYRTDKDFDYSSLYIPDDINDIYIYKIKDIFPDAPYSEYPEVALQTWKSYHLKPYIKYSNYLDFLFAEIKRTTGYTVNTSNSTFFDISNPYYANLIYTCKYLSRNKSWDNIISFYDSEGETEFPLVLPLFDNTKNYNYLFGNVKQKFTYQDGLPELDGNGKYRLNVSAKINWLNTIVNNEKVNKDFLGLAKKNGLILFPKIKFKTGTGYKVLHNKVFLLYGSKLKSNISFDSISVDYGNEDGEAQDRRQLTDNEIVRVEIPVRDATMDNPGQNVAVLTPDTDGKSYIYSRTLSKVTDRDSSETAYPDESVACSFYYELTQEEVDWIRTNVDNITEVEYGWRVRAVSPANTEDYYFEKSWYSYDEGSIYINNSSFSLEEFGKPKISFANLLGDDFNILHGFSNFLKIFNLICKVDYNTKEINILQRGEYFNNVKNTIIDLTDNLDFSQNIEFTDLISEYKNIKYTYEDNNSPVNVQSKENNGYTNNTVVRNLNIDQNVEDYNFLPGLNNSCIRQIKSNWFYDFVYFNYLSIHKNNPLVYDDNDVNGNALEEQTGQLLFRMWNDIDYSKFRDNSDNKTGFVVCDDSPYEINNDTYALVLGGFEDDNSWRVVVDSIPFISNKYYRYKIQDDVSFGDFLDFYEPSAVSGEWGPEAGGIYSVFHKNWNDIVYEDTKKVKAMFYFPLSKYYDFDFNRLIRIDNNIYLVLSIDEYSFNNEMMKCTLLLLNNINNLDTIPQLADEYLYILPSLTYLENTSLAQYTFGFWVYSSHNFTISDTGNRPEDNDGNPYASFDFTGITGSYTAGQYYFEVPYITNSYYPTTYRTDPCQILEIEQVEDSDEYGGLVDYVKVTNIEEISEPADSELIINPDYYVTPVNDNLTTDSFSFNVYSKSIVKHEIDQSGSIVMFDPHSYMSGGPVNGYNITVNYRCTAGTPGEEQYIRISNLYDQKTFRVIRGFGEHEVSIAASTNNSSPNYWILDYTSGYDCLTSEFPFEIRCNFDWYIEPEWFTEMYDPVVDEFCFSECKEDYPYFEDLDTGVTYSRGTGINGAANTIYRLKFVYSRKQVSANNPLYNGALKIHCAYSLQHPFTYNIRLDASNLNNL